MEKSLSELGDKISAADKQAIESALGRLKEAATGNDLAAIQQATEEVNKVFQKVSSELYQQAEQDRGNGGGQDGGAQGSSGAAEQDQTVEAEVVDKQ